MKNSFVIGTVWVIIAFTFLSFTKVDSLYIALSQSQNPIDTINAYISIGEKYAQSDQDSAFLYLNKSLDQSLELDYYKGAVLSYKNIATLYYYKQDYSEALVCLNKAKELFPYIEDEKEIQATIILNTGVMNTNLGKKYEAFVSFQKVLDLYRKINFKKGEANTLYNIGNIYSGLENQIKAKEYYLQAQAITESLYDSTTLTISLINLGWVNYKDHKYDEAEEDYKKASELAYKQNQKSLIILTNNNLAKMYVDLKENEKAKKVLKLNQEIFKNFTSKYSEAFTTLLLKYIQFSESPNQAVLSEVKEILEYSQEENYDQLELDCSIFLSDMESKLGNFPAAYMHLSKSKSVKDSLLKILTLDKQAFQPLEYEFQKLKQQKESEANKQKLTLYSLIGGVTFLLTILSLVLYNNQKIRQARILLQNKNVDLEKYIESNIKLQDFAHIASHDMRSPLLTISNFSGLLRNELYNSVTQEQKYFFDAIQGGAVRLNVLITDLLEYSKVNSQTLNYSAFSLNTIIKDIEDELKFNIIESQTEITIEPNDFSIQADYVKLKRVFQNLIDNSIKFKRKKNNLNIQIKAKEDHDFYHISVIDNGIGIGSEYLDKIFLPFSKLHSYDDYKGTGLGLSICKNIIKKHGGKIIAQNNRFSSGATIKFSIRKI